MRVIYGAKDRLLPDLSQTVAGRAATYRGHGDHQAARLRAFLQEESPTPVGELLARFFAAQPSAWSDGLTSIEASM